MTDIVSKKTRSRMMAGIRGKNTRPEMIVRRYLHAHGFRFRLHDSKLPGKPDLVLKKYRMAIFVHGCFWHRHEGCRYATTPATRPEFWEEKFSDNTRRDRQNLKLLHSTGWRTIIFWECATRHNQPEHLDKLETTIKNDFHIATEIPRSPPSTEPIMKAK